MAKHDMGNAKCTLFQKEGVKDIRELKEVVKTNGGKSIFITTNGYTKSAMSFANRA